MSYFDNIVAYYADMEGLIRYKMEKEPKIVLRDPNSKKDKFLQYVNGTYQYIGSSMGKLFSGNRVIEAAVKQAGYYDLFVLDKYNCPSRLLYIAEDGKLNSDRLMKDYGCIQPNRTRITPGECYDKEYFFYGVSDHGAPEKYLAVPCFCYEQEEMLSEVRNRILGTEENRQRVEKRMIIIRRKDTCKLYKYVNEAPDVLHEEIISFHEFAFLYALERQGNQNDNFRMVERKAEPDENSKKVISYIQSFDRMAQGFPEMDSLIYTFAVDEESNGSDFAHYLLVNYLNQSLDGKCTNAQRIMEQEPKLFRTYSEKERTDFTSVISLVLANMHPGGDNELELPAQYGGRIVITKEKKDIYCFSFMTADGRLVKRMEHHYEEALNALNYVNKSGVPMIPDEEKKAIAEELVKTYLSASFENSLECTYGTNAVIDRFDSPVVKVFKILAQKKAVILRKTMELTEGEVFIYLQRVDNYVISKSIESNRSNKRLEQLNFRGFGDERTARYHEAEQGKKIIRDYYLMPKNSRDKSAQNPDVRIITEMFTASRLTARLNGLYWRAWEIEKSNDLIDKIDMRDGVSVWSDKEAFRIARNKKIG